MKIAITSVLLFCFSCFSSAGIIFQDNFDAENGGSEQLNYNAFSNWNVSSGSVDLINSPGWFSQPIDLSGRGMFVDMDGSTGDSGRLVTKSKFFFSAGVQYKLSFDLAGNNRQAGTDRVRSIVTSIALPGQQLAQTFALGANQDFDNYELSFTGQGVEGRLVFRADIGNNQDDNIGLLLDNVKLVEVTEPTTLALLGFGLMGLMFMRRQSKA